MTEGQVLAGIDTPCRILTSCTLGAGIEATMGWQFGWSVPLPEFLYFGAVGAAVGATDLVLRRVPNRAVLPAHVVGPALLALASATSDRWPALVRAGATMLVLPPSSLSWPWRLPAGSASETASWLACSAWRSDGSVGTRCSRASHSASCLRPSTSAPDDLGPAHSIRADSFGSFMLAGALVVVFAVA